MKCFRTIRTSQTLEHRQGFLVFWFLKKNYALYFDDNGLIVTNDGIEESLKSLHKTIKGS
jgi:hypothetical protein